MTILHFTTNAATPVREITHDGKKYLIAPVIALKAGVVNGMHVPQEELSKFVEAWSGRVITLGHPQANGQYISANSPDLLTQHPGMLWNTYVDGDALKGEMWIDLAKATQIGGDAMVVVKRLRANQPVEVSTGYFADIEEGAGVYGGKMYDGVQRNIRPDHLALLPNEEGACNWADGCGAPRVNILALKTPTQGRKDAKTQGENMPPGLQTNELALDDRLHLVRRAFRKHVRSMAGPDMDDGWPEMDMVAIFDDTVIAKDWNAKTHTAYAWTISDAGEVAFGDPTPVDVVYRSKEGGTEVVIANDLQTHGAKFAAAVNRRIEALVTDDRSRADIVKQLGDAVNIGSGTVNTILNGNISCPFMNRQKFSTMKDSRDAFTAWGRVLGVSGQTLRNAAESDGCNYADEPATNNEQLAQGIFNRLLNFFKGEQPVNKEELVTALVANERCQFGKDKLAQWDVADLQTLQASLQANADDADPEPPAPTPTAQTNQPPQAIQLPQEITQFAQMIANLGGAEKLGEALGSLTANADQERTQMIAGILANERNTFEDAELQAMNTAQLRKLASAFAPRNYLGAAGAILNGHTEPDEYVLEMPAAWPEQQKA